MTVDEAGQHQVAADIKDRHAVREGRLAVLNKPGDATTGDPDIDDVPIGEAAVSQKGVEIHSAFLADDSRTAVARGTRPKESGFERVLRSPRQKKRIRACQPGDI